MKENQKKNYKKILVTAAVLFSTVAAVYLYTNRKVLLPEVYSPSLTLTVPPAVDVTDREEIVIDVVLSNLPENRYPASSISVEFDNNKLEFTGVKQGTMMTLGGPSKQQTYHIPIWLCDIEASNRRGQVNTMYLDITGGDYAYVPEGFDKKDKNILLRLAFRLRDSAVRGEVYHITFEDAVIATAENARDGSSLASENRTLKLYHGKIVVKE